jgi:selenocysteine lyase/cysteine desulfurase
VIEDVQGALADEYRIVTSSRGGGIRVSLHAYNSDDDVDALVAALAALPARGRRV